MTLVYLFFLNSNGKCFEIPRGNAGMLCKKMKTFTNACSQSDGFEESRLGIGSGSAGRCLKIS